MRTNLFALLVLSSVWLAACGAKTDDAQPDGTGDGGTAGSGGMAGNGGSGGHDGTAGSAGSAGGSGGAGGGDALEGSYDVLFKGVEVEWITQPGVARAPVSEGHAARIDLAKNPTGDGYVAVFTSRWGKPAAYAVSVADDAVTLTGEGTVSSDRTSDPWGLLDTWKSLVLARRADGRLAGSLKATGQTQVIEGDVAYGGEVKSGGTVASDTTAPELSPAPKSAKGPADALLPWDAFDVEVAEGVDAAKLEASLYVAPSAQAGNGGAMQSVAWELTPEESDVSWAGATHATGRFVGWDGTGGPSLKLGAAAGIPDLAGNPSAAVSKAFTLLDVPRAAGFELDDEASARPASWGAVRFVGQKSGSDPACEAGGCAIIEPFDNNVCGNARAGLAMRFPTVSSPRAIAIRFRVASGSSYLGGDGPPPTNDTFPAPISVELVEPGRAPEAGPQIKVASWQDLGPGEELRYRSEWQTAKVPIGAASTAPELGLTIHAGSEWGTRPCYGGPYPPPTKTQVVIDSIRLE